MSERRVLLLITFLVVLAEVAMTFNSVLLPNMKSEFMLSGALLQMTSATMLISLGVAGIIYGGLSDCVGRKPLIVFGVCCFSVGSLLGYITQHIEILFLGRILQGVGAGVAWIIGNAAIRDVFNRDTYVVAMNRLHIAAGIVPAVAPILGSFIAQEIGWRYCFLLLTTFGALMCIMNSLFLKETIKVKKAPTWHNFSRAYHTILKNPNTLRLILCKALFVSAIFVDCSNMPLISVSYLGFSSTAYSFFIGCTFVCYIMGSMFSEKLCVNYCLLRLIYIGASILLFANLLSYILLQFSINVFWIYIIKFLSYIGYGLIFGNCTAAVVISAGPNASAAAAVMISCEMLLSGFAIYCVGLFFSGTFVPMTVYGIIAPILAMPLLYNVIYQNNADEETS